MRIYRRKLRNYIIQLPDVIRKGGIRNKSYYPTIKFISISKAYESGQEYVIRGRKRKMKVYGIGILTTDNIYYYSELWSRNTELTERQVEDLKKVFLSRFNYTKDTYILLSDNMAGKYTNDPIKTFLSIISSCFGLSIRTQTLLHKLQFLNLIYNYIKVKHIKDFTPWRKLKLYRKLFKNERFEFITDKEHLESIKKRDTISSQAAFECAIGILYCHEIRKRRDILREYSKNIIEKDIKKDIEKDIENHELHNY